MYKKVIVLVGKAFCLKGIVPIKMYGMFGACVVFMLFMVGRNAGIYGVEEL